jgi:CheY-like chemotaxis protein
MLTQQPIERISPTGRTQALRTVIVVGQPGQQVPESAFDALGYDIVVLEPLARAYTQIKRVMPTVIVMSVSLDDLESFQLLTMLKLDPATASIPVRLFVAPETEESDEEVAMPDNAESFASIPLSMN